MEKEYDWQTGHEDGIRYNLKEGHWDDGSQQFSRRITGTHAQSNPSAAAQRQEAHSLHMCNSEQQGLRLRPGGAVPPFTEIRAAKRQACPTASAHNCKRRQPRNLFTSTPLRQQIFRSICRVRGSVLGAGNGAGTSVWADFLGEMIRDTDSGSRVWDAAHVSAFLTFPGGDAASRAPPELPASRTPRRPLVLPYHTCPHAHGQQLRLGLPETPYPRGGQAQDGSPRLALSATNSGAGGEWPLPARTAVGRNPRSFALGETGRPTAELRGQGFLLCA